MIGFLLPYALVFVAGFACGALVYRKNTSVAETVIADAKAAVDSVKK